MDVFSDECIYLFISYYWTTNIDIGLDRIRDLKSNKDGKGDGNEKKTIALIIE